MNYCLREEWEPSPPPSRSSHEMQRGETTPGRAMRGRVTNKHQEVFVTACDKANGRTTHAAPLVKSHGKDTLYLKGEELLPRHRSLLMLCSWMQWEHRLKSQTSGASACLSEGTGRSLCTPPKLQARGSDQEEHHSWNKGMLDTFWPSWHCSRHYTDQQTRLSKN